MHIIIKFLKTNVKEKILKASRDKKTCYIQRNIDTENMDDGRFLFWKQSKQEDSGMTDLKK